jgi:hypothetical protein
MVQEQKSEQGWAFHKGDHKFAFAGDFSTEGRDAYVAPLGSPVEPGKRGLAAVATAIVPFRNGMHASTKLLDALYFSSFTRGSVISRIQLSGELTPNARNDILAARNGDVLWSYDADQVLHQFACWVAEQAIEAERKLGKQPDARSVAAVAAKRKWLAKEIGDKELAAAQAAAAEHVSKDHKEVSSAVHSTVTTSGMTAIACAAASKSGSGSAVAKATVGAAWWAWWKANTPQAEDAAEAKLAAMLKEATGKTF